MSSVKWTLLNLHLWSIALDYGFTILTVPLLIFPAMAGFPLGILTNWFEVPTVYQIYLVMSLIFVVCVSIVAIFENRYYQIFAKDRSWRYFRFPFLFINYLLCFTYLIPAYLTIPDQTTALEHTFKQVPNLPADIKNGPLFVLAVEIKYIGIPYIFMALLVLFESFLFIGLIYKNMKATSTKSTQSVKTVKLQKKFLNAIYAQVHVFLINLQAPMAYLIFSIFSGYYNQSFNNMVFIVSSLHGVSSSLIMLWAHKPYREFCFSLFKNGRTSMIQSITVSAVAVEESRHRGSFARVL